MPLQKAALRAWPGKIIRFFRKNTVLLIALIAAFSTSLIVPPDKEWASYFDFKTLTCLLCMLSVVCALWNINFFYILAQKIVRTFKNARLCILALVYTTFIGSMLIANDMALITFLPLGYFVLHSSGKDKYMAPAFILQNIAANLGGMLTPFGNPQNLYMYSRFSIPTDEFIAVMFPPFLASVALITLCCLFIRPENMTVAESDAETGFYPRRAVCYLLLFALSILIVFRAVPYGLGLFIIPTSVLLLDRKAMRMVDYPLLGTFVCFFIFAGNMGRIDAVRAFFSRFLERDTLLFGTLSCQFISNVPSAILLSQFTENYRELLLAVNIGGTGTLIASLASLITFKEYVLHNPGGSKRYILLFSAFNFGFLVILTLFCMLYRTTF